MSVIGRFKCSVMLRSFSFIPKNLSCRRVACRRFTTSSLRQQQYTHAVIGHGLVGRAIAVKLAEREGTSTVLLEREERGVCVEPIRVPTNFNVPKDSDWENKTLLDLLQSGTSSSPQHTEHAKELLDNIETLGGEVISECSVSAISPHAWSGEYVITTFDYSTYQSSSVEAEMLINASGPLSADVSNKLLPEVQHVQGYYLRTTWCFYRNCGGVLSDTVIPSMDGQYEVRLWYTGDGGVVIGSLYEWVEDGYDNGTDESSLEKLREHLKTHIPESSAWQFEGSRCDIEFRQEKTLDPVSPFIKTVEGYENFVSVAQTEQLSHQESLQMALEVDELLYANQPKKEKKKGVFGVW